jgi:glycosyltransferase involved in cell wall biosynthesis
VFLARTWDPAELPDMVRGYVDELNDTRAACIRLLRKRFGERFFGGLARSAHALARYPDCVVDADISTRRRDYLARLRGYSICVATTGLWDSIGWKFAEYLAFGKAIVCEPMKFELPGPMAAGRNFLEFTTPEGCASAVGELLENSAARERMMADNAAYFAEFGAPDAVVARALHAALRPRPV